MRRGSQTEGRTSAGSTQGCGTGRPRRALTGRALARAPAGSGTHVLATLLALLPCVPRSTHTPDGSAQRVPF